MWVKDVPCALALLSALILTGTVSASAEWYEDAGSSYHHVSQTACDVMTSGITKWFQTPNPYQLQGHPATNRLYAAMTKAQRDSITGGQVLGMKVVDSHTLSSTDGKTLSTSYTNAANVKVPFVIQVATLPFPPIVGAGVTLFDWLLQQNQAQQATANDVAVLIRDGGKLDKVLIVTKDAQARPWLMTQIVFRTTVNDVLHSYVVCSWSSPVKLQ